MIEAVFFDVGSTLLHPQPSVAETFAEMARARGHALAVSHVEPHMAAVNEFYEREYLRDGDFWCSHERATAIWLDMYRYLAQLVGLDADAEGLAHDAHQAFWHADRWALYPDVTPCLRALKRSGLKLGVISNWDAGLEGLLRDIALLPYFDDVVSSAVVGYRKPDHVVFDLALERLGVQASRAMHVGDLPEADGDGAASAGIRPLIIDRHGTAHGCAYERIASLEQVVGCLR